MSMQLLIILLYNIHPTFKITASEDVLYLIFFIIPSILINIYIFEMLLPLPLQCMHSSVIRLKKFSLFFFLVISIILSFVIPITFVFVLSSLNNDLALAVIRAILSSFLTSMKSIKIIPLKFLSLI